MLSVSVRLLHGTIRTGSPDDTAVTGGRPEGEWPPSPARLFSALVAADGTRDRCRVTNGDELLALERLGPPTIVADADADVHESVLRPRYAVVDRTSSGAVQDYPGRSAAEVRPGVRLCPRTPSITYVWDEHIDPVHVDALRRRAARVGYLGCADSPVQVKVATGPPPQGPAPWRPGGRAAGRALPVPFDGFTSALDHAFDAWSAGEAMRRSWVPTRRQHYALTGNAQAVDDRAVTIWLDFERRVAPTRVLLVASTLREAVIDHCDRLLGDGAGPAGRRAPWLLHGHDIPPDVPRPYQLARFLPLADVGHRHASGAVLGAAVWLPPGAPAELVEAVRAAVTGRLRRLRSMGLDVAVRPVTGAGGRRATDPRRWQGPARRWVSATPVVAERGRKRGPNLDDVRRWFAHAGHPEPSWARVSPAPVAPGVPRLRPREVHRHGKDRHPYFWIEAGFSEPVEGPLCVGRSRSLGMGLLAPVPARRPATGNGQGAPT